MTDEDVIQAIGRLCRSQDGRLVHSASGHLVYKTLFVQTTGWAYAEYGGSPGVGSRFGSDGATAYVLDRVADYDGVRFAFIQPNNGGWYQSATVTRDASGWTMVLDMHDITGAEHYANKWFLSTWHSGRLLGAYDLVSFEHGDSSQRNDMTALSVRLFDLTGT